MRALLERLTIVLFALALAAPALASLLRPGVARASVKAERREPAAWPAAPRNLAELAQFPRRLEQYHADALGLRDVLLRWNAHEHWDVLGRSPSEFVARGRHDWCFMTGENSRAVQRGLAPFKKSELDGWVARLRERQRWLAEQGVAYLFVLCPSKQTIYPGEAPEDWEPLGPTRLDQFAERLAREPDLPFLDLRPALRAELVQDRPGDFLYTRFGSHWNGRGAYAAYRAIVTRLRAEFPGLRLLAPDELEPLEVRGVPESLAHQLYLTERLRERQYDLVRRGGPTHEVLHPSYKAAGAMLVTRAPGDGPRLLWAHDSFGVSIASLLCESFSFVQAHFQAEFPRASVAVVRPDVVLETYVERVLARPPPRALGRLPTTPEERFDAAQIGLWREPSSAGRAARPFGTAELERAGALLELRCAGARDGLLLPELALGAGQQALLRLLLECRATTEVDVYVARAGSGNFSPRQHVLLELGPDRPAGVVVLPDVGPSFDLLLRPHPPARTLSIRALELRGAPAEE